MNGLKIILLHKCFSLPQMLMNASMTHVITMQTVQTLLVHTFVNVEMDTKEME